MPFCCLPTTRKRDLSLPLPCDRIAAAISTFHVCVPPTPPPPAHAVIQTSLSSPGVRGVPRRAPRRACGWWSSCARPPQHVRPGARSGRPAELARREGRMEKGDRDGDRHPCLRCCSPRPPRHGLRMSGRQGRGRREGPTHTTVCTLSVNNNGRTMRLEDRHHAGEYGITMHHTTRWHGGDAAGSTKGDGLRCGLRSKTEAEGLEEPRKGGEGRALRWRPSHWLKAARSWVSVRMRRSRYSSRNWRHDAALPSAMCTWAGRGGGGAGTVRQGNSTGARLARQ